MLRLAHLSTTTTTSNVVHGEWHGTKLKVVAAAAAAQVLKKLVRLQASSTGRDRQTNVSFTILFVYAIFV
jgi:hypothetical protein